MESVDFCGLSNFTRVEDLDNFYWWNLTNGSIIFCNYGPQCESQFAPDTDIAGWGVIIAFIVTAWLTILIAAINAAYPTRDAYQRFRRWYPQRHRPQHEQAPFQPRIPRARLEMFTDHVLLALCDLQLVTGTAILVAGFVQWQTISFYHRAMVTNFGNLTLGSLWASRASGCRTVEADDASVWAKYRGRIRNLFIMIAVVLLAALTALQIRSEKQDWDFFESGKCYRYHIYAIPASAWLWVAGLSLYALVLCLQSILVLHQHGEENWKAFTHIFPDKLTKAGKLCLDQADEVPPCFLGCLKPIPSRQLARAIVALLITCSKLIVLTVLLSLAWCFLQFWAIWSAGRGFQAVEVTFYAAYALWNTVDVIDLKLSNSPLLTGSEDSWGFGQVLPLYLLLMLGFNLFDVAEKTYGVKRPHQQDDDLNRYHT